ncbi:MAG: hypothetical protein HYV60_07415 [Planctomycetia bacterium]|nr:hypothetical protein [Planctomycetia bacterium]
MKPTLFATTATILLLTTATANAGPGHRYFTELGRNIGYGVGDGYHAQRYCLPACAACNSCSPIQQPTIQQPIMPQPAMADAYSQWAPHQLPQVRYPVGYYAAPVYQPQHQPSVPIYGQPIPVLQPVARPDHSPASHW